MGGFVKLESVRGFLTPYRIAQKRETTIAHAFASAIAPVAEYDAHERRRFEEAMEALGQDPSNLRCVYCDQIARTWDHVYGLVREGLPSGYGHVLGNLVPCCSDCNSQKGSKDWESFLSSKSATLGTEAFTLKRQLLLAYVQLSESPDRFREFLRDECGDEYREFYALKNQIVEMMRQADKISESIRQKRRRHFGSTT
jgi:hypothetical protein